MAINTIHATIQERYGAEENLDPDQLTTGEWAVATDTEKVWMCFRPGLVLRMATYEGFEQDMKEIQDILAECQDIQTAVAAFEKLAEDHEERSKYYSSQSKLYFQQAEQTANDAVQAINSAFENINVGLPRFVINPDDGKLYHTPSRFTFAVNYATGNLDWGLTL